MPEKLLPPGVSIANASDVLLMKVRVKSYPTKEEAERIIEANRPFYQGELRATDKGYEIWKPLVTGDPGPRLSIDQIQNLKRGDLIRFLLVFPTGIEFVTCVATAKASTLIRCRVYSSPENTRSHGVDYGDELVVNESQIVTHEVSNEQVMAGLQSFLTGVVPEPIPVNAEDAKLRQVTKNLPALTPVAGNQYWTRNGMLVTVWTQQTQKVTLCSACNRQLLGSNIQHETCPALGTYHDWREIERSIWIGGSQDGTAAIEWNPNGSHAGGLVDLDIVKDPKMNEVLA